MDDLISRQATIDALEKEKPIPFVNKDGSIDPFGAGRQNQWYRDGIAIMNLSSAQPEQTCKYWDSESKFCSLCRPSAHSTLYGYNIEHLKLIARILQKENLPPERVVEALTDINRVVAIVVDEYEETLKYKMEEFMYGQDMGNPEDGSL